MRTMSDGPCPYSDCFNRNSFGYCKTTACINKYYQQEQWNLPLIINKSESVAIKPQTNADRIRVMSDGELAEIMALWCPPNYPHECHRYKKSDGDLNCSKCWFDWLRAEEDET